MKAKELIELFSQAPEAEVGYEHLKITNAWLDSDKYIELDGQTARVNYTNNTSGVFVVLIEYEDAAPEVYAVYLTREKAEKLKKWFEECKNMGEEPYAHIKRVTVKNVFISE